MTKYRLPTNHDLFQTQSVPELMLEWYEDLYEEMDDIEAAIKDEAIVDAAELGRLQRRLETLQKALGMDVRIVTGDPLVDYWEAEIAAGRVPDLDMTLEDLEKLKNG